MRERAEAAGEARRRRADKNTAGVFNVMASIAFIIAVVILVALDVVIAPFWITEFGESNNSDSMTDVVFKWTPWVYSLATTGLNYALWDRSEYGFRHRPPLARVMYLLAWVIALADTAIDVGGWTAWLYPPDQAAQIIPDGGGSGQWQAGAVVVFVFCLLHEPILMKLLARYKDNKQRNEIRGDAFFQAVVAGLGNTLNFFKIWSKRLGIGCMVALDVVLIPQMSGSTSWPHWVWTAASTGLVYGLWDWHRRVGGLKAADTRTKILLAVAWSASIIDTFFDLAGFMALMYGKDRGFYILPPGGFKGTTVTAWIGIMIVALMCWAAEPLIREILWQPEEGGPIPFMPAANPAPEFGGGLGGGFGGGGLGGFGGDGQFGQSPGGGRFDGFSGSGGPGQNQF